MAPCLVKASSSYYTRGSWQSKRATWRVLKLMCGREADGDDGPGAAGAGAGEELGWLARMHPLGAHKERNKWIELEMPVPFFPAWMAMHSRMFLVFGWTAALLASGGASWTWGRSEAKGLCDTRRISLAS